MLGVALIAAPAGGQARRPAAAVVAVSTAAPAPEPPTTTTPRPDPTPPEPPGPTPPDTPATSIPEPEPTGPVGADGGPAVRFPSDSELAALTDLARVRFEIDGADRTIGQVAEILRTARAELGAARARKEASVRRRTARAAAAYRDQSSGWRVRGEIPDSLARARAILLLARADHVERGRLRALDRRIDRLRGRIRAAVALRDAVTARRDALRAEEQVLVEKLAWSGGELRLVAPAGPVEPGPDAIARAADVARRELERVTAWGGDLAADPAWLEARRVLAARLVASPWVREQPPARAIDGALAAAPPAALRVVLFALSQVGKPYVYATAGPASYDCSGLTKRAWQEAGLGLPHFSGAQLRLGVAVPVEQLRAGDLLAYGPMGSEHVTMAVGGGLVVEARGRAAGVIIASARTDPVRDGFAGAVRLLP